MYNVYMHVVFTHNGALGMSGSLEVYIVRCRFADLCERYSAVVACVVKMPPLCTTEISTPY